MGSTTNLGSTTGRPNSPFGNLTLTLGFCIVVAATSLRVQYSSRSCVPRAGLKIRHGLYLNRPVRGRIAPAFGPDGEEEKRGGLQWHAGEVCQESCPFFGKSGCPGTSSGIPWKTGQLHQRTAAGARVVPEDRDTPPSQVDSLCEKGLL